MNSYLRAALTALALAMTATSAIALSIGDPHLQVVRPVQGGMPLAVGKGGYIVTPLGR